MNGRIVERVQAGARPRPAAATAALRRAGSLFGRTGASACRLPFAVPLGQIRRRLAPARLAAALVLALPALVVARLPALVAARLPALVRAALPALVVARFPALVRAALPALVAAALPALVAAALPALVAAALPALVLVAALPAGAAAEVLRVATYNAGLSRDAPGLLLRDVLRREEQVEAAAAVVRALGADVLLLTGIDHDHRGRALGAFLDLVREGKDGIDYPHVFAPPVNAGVPSGLDLDGDGRTMGWGDGWGWGKFPGHSGMALVSRLPIDAAGARTFGTFLWRDLPEASLPEWPDGRPWPDEAAQAVMRLSSRGHWDVAVLLPGGGRLHLLASYPTPPVFDGPEGRNLRRNDAEIDFWRRYLDGWTPRDDAGREAAAPEAPVVLVGDLNADPADGDGLRRALQRLLAHPRLKDPAPRSAGGAAAAAAQGGANARHLGDPALDTADWRDDPGPGNLRVDYVLPDARLAAAAAGVLWPLPDEPLGAAVEAASSHRPVWVDVNPGGLDRLAAGR